ncbi:hypothetical protein T440DRAFT_210386 [Plenodomus tracheiphilus IPT5]|uniref:N-acetyltransferase domain-containing protein n=1 Tax=Plenodomus tracheiphilus IPT5 TaxID=1408161 RepID=A0A6A7BJ08_9PLEO|nr:hypothetical protein T440DRAFT_210386 [Plenodomus tracheiphilus IPT5]
MTANSLPNMFPTYHLRVAKYQDLPAIAAIWTAAFFDDEIIGQLMHPHRKQYPEDVYWFLLRGVREHFWDWRHQHMVVIATTQEKEGRIVERVAGAADWRRLGPGGCNRELIWADPILSCTGNLFAPILRWYHKVSMTAFPNRAADETQSNWLADAVAKSEQHWTGARAECWDLHICGVHPEFQLKGVGKQLAQWGIHEAAKEGDNIVASVLCGEKNRGFYQKAGFPLVAMKGEGGLALFTK